MPLQATSGAASYDAFGGGVPVPKNYIEDVFSTYLYTGNGAGATQTITNGIDLAGKGGLVWIKNRAATNSASGLAADHVLMDSVTNGRLRSNTTVHLLAGQNITRLTSGFSVIGTELNVNPDNFVSWTFRKQPKFFDVVTFTGTGVARTVNHNLGSVPGMILLKCTSDASNWIVYHRSTTASTYLFLNAVNGGIVDPAGAWNGVTPTSTSFTVSSAATVNGAGLTFVAYVFAHNAGGFGLTGTDNVISCGSFTTDGSGNASVSLGYEPQWVLYKSSTAPTNWFVIDNMRGLTTNGTDSFLLPNLSDAEGSGPNYIAPNATGFSSLGNLAASSTFIYMAIRRPMKVPTTGTSVFKPFSGFDFQNATPGFPVDMYITRYTAGIYNPNGVVGDRLRGTAQTLFTTSTAAETAGNTNTTTFKSNTAFAMQIHGDLCGEYLFQRAPGFFDEVCYTGTGVARTLNHNLGAVPELMIVKRRDGTSYGDWLVYHASLGNTKYLLLNTSGASATANSGAWNFTNPTSTQFTVGDWDSLNTTATYVAYLFATCPGVSKVGSYTGTGTTQTINCGFTAGSRFVLIKRTDSTGDWYVWDSARGIVAGNDPYLLLNSTAAEVTSTDYVDAYSAGFEISSTAPAAINASGGTFIYLAIA